MRKAQDAGDLFMWMIAILLITIAVASVVYEYYEISIGNWGKSQAASIEGCPKGTLSFQEGKEYEQEERVDGITVIRTYHEIGTCIVDMKEYEKAKQK
jgi:hypothetical protein